MADTQVDSESLGPLVGVDVATRTDDQATRGESDLRDLRESWAEPADGEVDEIIDTKPYRAIVAAPITTPLAPEQPAVAEPPDLAEDATELVVDAPVDASVEAPEAEAPGAEAGAVAEDAIAIEAEAPAVELEVTDEVRITDVSVADAPATGLEVADVAVADVAAADAAVADAPAPDLEVADQSVVDLEPEDSQSDVPAVVAEVEQPETSALLAEETLALSEDATAPSESLEASEVDETLLASAPEFAEDVPVADEEVANDEIAGDEIAADEIAADEIAADEIAADESPEALETSAQAALADEQVLMVESESLEAESLEAESLESDQLESSEVLVESSDEQTLIAEPKLVILIGEEPVLTEEPAAPVEDVASAEESVAPAEDVAPDVDADVVVASEAPALDVPQSVDAAPTETEDVAEVDSAASIPYGYASAPTRPRSAVPPFAPLPPPFSVPPTIPLLPTLTVQPSAPPTPPIPLQPPMPSFPVAAVTSSWSVAMPNAADAAPQAGPLLPPLPEAAASAPPQSPRTTQPRLPSIAGIDTRVPQEYWLEDDPMEQTRLSLGLSGERPVVREAGLPLPQPKRFKRPPRPVSLFVFFLVLAIIIIALAGMIFTVAHLLSQPPATPTVIPTHTALPTSTPTQNL